MPFSTSCHHQPACPGCPRYGKKGVSSTAFAALGELAETWGYAHPEINDFPAWGYRHRVRLSVRRGREGLLSGIFETGSHRLVHIPDCPLHHPSIEAFLERILETASQCSLDVYDEGSHTGLLRALQLSVEPQTGKVQAVFLVRDALAPGHQVEKKLDALLEGVQGDSLTHSLWLGALPQRTNSLNPESVVRVHGPEAFVDWCGGVEVSYPPDAFGQANPLLHSIAVEKIHELVPRDSSVIEYYCGVGTIGLGLVARGQSVQFNEVGAGSLRGLRLGLSKLPAADKRALILPGQAGDHAEAYLEEHTVIVDPPRKGLDPALLSRLVRTPPQRLIYLSCGLASLLKESAQLRGAGRLRLVFLSAYNYFPHTEHIETLAVWERIE